jgi:hypothetical protein
MRVVPVLQEAERGSPRLGLRLERPTEPIEGITFISWQRLPNALARVLAAPITVMDDALVGSTQR